MKIIFVFETLICSIQHKNPHSSPITNPYTQRGNGDSRLKEKSTVQQPQLVVVPNRQRVVLGEIPDLSFPQFQPKHKLQVRRNPNPNPISIPLVVLSLHVGISIPLISSSNLV
jgi:hypothetical protein